MAHRVRGRWWWSSHLVLDLVELTLGRVYRGHPPARRQAGFVAAWLLLAVAADLDHSPGCSNVVSCRARGRMKPQSDWCTAQEEDSPFGRVEVLIAFA